MAKVKVDYKTLGMVGTNCYFIVNEDTMDTVIVDPADNSNAIIERVEEKGYIPKAVFLTHGHFDHMMAGSVICEKYDIECYGHEDEQEIIQSAAWNLSSSFLDSRVWRIGHTVKDGEVLDVAGMKFKVLHTPGHTKGSCCYYLEEEHILMSGDTIFHESVGRTDFPTGSPAELLKSIRDKLFVLPDDVKVYPGHGDATTLSYEKMNNCCVQYL